MYVQGNYPYCYNQVNCREYPSVKNDPSVYYVEDNKMFRQASIIKAKSYEKHILEIDKIIVEIEELEKLQMLPHEEQVKRLEEAEEDEEDFDSDELLKKRRLETFEPQDDPDDAKLGAEIESEKHSQYQGTYHALEYKTASLENFYKKIDSRVSTEGDSFMRCILEGHKDLSSDKDRFLTEIGCGD